MVKEWSLEVDTVKGNKRERSLGWKVALKKGALDKEMDSGYMVRSIVATSTIRSIRSIVEREGMTEISKIGWMGSRS